MASFTKLFLLYMKKFKKHTQTEDWFLTVYRSVHLLPCSPAMAKLKSKNYGSL